MERNDDRKIRWRLSPIYTNCIFCVIELLIVTYYDGPQMEDDQGIPPRYLTYHDSAPKGIIVTLLNMLPESVNVKDRKCHLSLDFVES